MGSIAFCISGSGWKIPGRSSGTSCCNAGVTTMKMISRTSVTSTSGVTLMSGWTVSFATRLRHQTARCRIAIRPLSVLLLLLLLLLLPLEDLLLGPALDRIEQLSRRIVEAGL